MTFPTDPEINLCEMSSKNADVILKTISDPDHRKIITCINKEPKPVKQISYDTGLSVSTTYRKIKELNKKNLLILSGGINTEKKREFRYQSKICKVITEFDGFRDRVQIYTKLN